ncbi:MAG: hypothetical protein ACOY3P_12875 [Planctomycetota bacterium]
MPTRDALHCFPGSKQWHTILNSKGLKEEHMGWSRAPLDLSRLKAFPLAERRSLTTLEEILVDPDRPPPQLPARLAEGVTLAAEEVRAARKRNASVMLIYGAHLIKNGGARVVDRLIESGNVTHLATNGAGTIHDWEFAYQGRSTESVRDNVAIGRFGTWEETGRNLHLAILLAGVNGEGYGRGLGRLIAEDGIEFPQPAELEEQIRAEPGDTLTAARAELLYAMRRHGLAAGRHGVVHRWKHASVLASAFTHDVPLTVHPGIGYDIIANHPMFSGAAIGRAAHHDFAQFGAAVEGLDGGVVLSVGSAIMGPQVFEKSLSCVNNLRLQDGRAVVAGHSIFVVDLQDSGGWDWTAGEPPKDSPAYYLRFCKSYARMGGAMHYLQCDNIAFLHNLTHQLASR